MISKQKSWTTSCKSPVNPGSLTDEIAISQGSFDLTKDDGVHVTLN